MEPSLSDREFKMICDLFLETDQGEWKLLLGRAAFEETHYFLKDPKDKNSELLPRVTKSDPRWDIFCGDNPATRVQITHFHPEAPQISARHVNLKNGHFLVAIHNLMPKIIAEIKRMKGNQNGT